MCLFYDLLQESLFRFYTNYPQKMSLACLHMFWTQMNKSSMMMTTIFFLYQLVIDLFSFHPFNFKHLDIAVNDLTPNSFPRNYATNFYSPELYMDLDDLDNENVQTYDDYHPVEKREATLTQTNEDNDDIEMIPANPDDLQYVISPIDQDFFPPDGRFYYGDDQEVILPVVVEDDWNTRTNHRHNDKNTLLDTIYQDEAEDMPNVDFEYVDEARDNKDDDEMLYYNPDNEPVEVESVFNRHGRLDVKKPGPFFPNSPNNFYLDKLPDDIEDEDYMEDDEGQTEYEYPLSPEEPREKKDYNQQLLTFPQSSVPKEDYLYINIKDR